MNYRISRPFDAHVHFRDDIRLARTVADTSMWFRGCIVEPNLLPPVLTVEDAMAYRERIGAAYSKRMKADADLDRDLDDGSFNVHMLLYLTDETSVAEVEKAAANPHVVGFKLYPQGATTNSARGVTHLERVREPLKAMEGTDLVLQIHGEVTDEDVDVFDREAIFIERSLRFLCFQYPDLKVSLEHITTEEAVRFVQQQGDNVGASITAHHLLLNRNDLFMDKDRKMGIQPHNFCLPILKAERHQMWLLNAATSGSPKFYAGTDSAPHAVHTKEATCGCAGCYTAPDAIELYAEAFWREGGMDYLNDFLCEWGPRFYGIAVPPLNDPDILLTRRAEAGSRERNLLFGTAPAVDGKSSWRQEVRPFAASYPNHWDVFSAD